MPRFCAARTCSASAERLGPRVVREDRRAAADRVDQLLRDLRAYGGTSPAATETAEDFDGLAADVIRAVKNDGALFGHVVESRIEPAKLQRIAVVPDVRVAGDVETEAGFFAAGIVGEESRDVTAGVFSVRAQLAKQKS